MSADEQGDAESHVYNVEVSRTVSTTVDVSAVSAEAAAEQVNLHSFPLPAMEDWQAHKDWAIRVFDMDGDQILEVER